MKVKELIASLQDLPKEAEVSYVYDGKARGVVEIVYLASSGDVVVADLSEYVNEPKDKPSQFIDPLKVNNHEHLTMVEILQKKNNLNL